MRPGRFSFSVGGAGKASAKCRALLALVLLAAASSNDANAQSTPHATAESQPAPLPDWLKPGAIRFARFDGGPIETQKALRSAWAAGFSPSDFAVLTNLYGTYADRMIDLLVQARVNFVWVTYSVGFSWREEEAQRQLVKEVVKKLHAHGIKAAAYVCATTVFWESLFKDDPQSVKWILVGSDGVPYRYSAGRDAMRFIADVNSAGWVEYQKHRVGAIIDDGLDAIFFDNPTLDDYPNDERGVVRFFDQILSYARRERKSNIPFFTNLGLQPPFNLLNRQLDFIFTEGWAEPGAWENHWEVSNIRRDRLVKGLQTGFSPIVSEYSHFHQGDRNDSYLEARSVKLAIAEAAAFGTAYTWDMEGPFDTALMAQETKALKTWAAISQYNGFLADHPELYTGASNITPLVVLLPDSLDPGFDWTGGAVRLDFLARNSVLAEFKFAGRVTNEALASYQGVIVPAYSSLSAERKEMIQGYQRGGGKISIFAETPSANGLNAEILPPSQHNPSKTRSTEAQALAEIVALAPEATHIELENTTNHVLANVTSVKAGQTFIVHLLNYDRSPSSEIKFKLALGKEFQKLVKHKPTLLSPDGKTPELRNVEWKGSTMDFTISSIDTYAVIVLQ